MEKNLNGYPVLVQMTQSDRGYIPQESNTISIPAEKIKILNVKNLSRELGEDDIQPIFGAFGEIKSIELIKGKQTNQAYIEFRKGAEATQAMIQLNGLEVVGNQILVELFNENNFHNNSSIEENRSARFEDESGNGGVIMTMKDKQSLMSNLAKRAGLSIPQTNNMTPVIKKDEMDSRCILLKNMFDGTKETDPDFDLEIREDVKEEVSIYGTLLHIYVDKTSVDGRIYMKFDNKVSSHKALNALHGRWFAKNRIYGEFMSEKRYSGIFPGI